MVVPNEVDVGQHKTHESPVDFITNSNLLCDGIVEFGFVSAPLNKCRDIDGGGGCHRVLLSAGRPGPPPRGTRSRRRRPRRSAGHDSRCSGLSNVKQRVRQSKGRSPRWRNESRPGQSVPGSIPMTTLGWGDKRTGIAGTSGPSYTSAAIDAPRWCRPHARPAALSRVSKNKSEIWPAVSVAFRARSIRPRRVERFRTSILPFACGSITRVASSRRVGLRVPATAAARPRVPATSA